MNKNMQIYAYYECNDSSGDLKSFQIVLADEFDDQKTLLAEVGPSSAIEESNDSINSDDNSRRRRRALQEEQDGFVLVNDDNM